MPFNPLLLYLLLPVLAFTACKTNRGVVKSHLPDCPSAFDSAELTYTSSAEVGESISTITDSLIVHAVVDSSDFHGVLVIGYPRNGTRQSKPYGGLTDSLGFVLLWPRPDSIQLRWMTGISPWFAVPATVDSITVAVADCKVTFTD